MIVAWFSAGISSAVAIKLAQNVDKIIYIHIDDQHLDTLRFIKDCEVWFDKPITILQSPYKSVEDACRGVNYLKGVNGAACTRLLKTRIRKEWEAEQSGEITYVWGMDYDERDRAERLVDGMPKYSHSFPLIDNQFTKQKAHDYFYLSGIKRPLMYELGYQNNNCVGCIKGGMGYWNKIRQDFPEVFEKRAKLERLIGASILKDKNGLVYLDELSPDRGRNDPPIIPDCGINCEINTQGEPP